MQRIKQIRTEQDVSLCELARRSGIARPNLWKIETGRISPTTRTLDRIADALDVDTADLFPRTRRLATIA